VSFVADEVLAALARAPRGLTRSEIAVATGTASYNVYRPLSKLAAAGAIATVKIDGARRWRLRTPRERTAAA